MRYDRDFELLVNGYQIRTGQRVREQIGATTGWVGETEDIVIIECRSDGRKVEIPRYAWDKLFRMLNAMSPSDDYDR